jgi:hypothetical protein
LCIFEFNSENFEKIPLDRYQSALGFKNIK